MNDDLPVTPDQARAIARWLDAHYGARIAQSIAGTAYPPELVYAIACKETGPMLVPMIEAMPPEDVPRYCVFDASGDAPDTRRTAFPANTAVFREAYGDEITKMLIAEANASRLLRGLPWIDWVYKGYGIFQYDLQHIKSDEAFFTDRQWYDFDPCIERLVMELDDKMRAHANNLTQAIVAYNGSGARAEQYGRHVMQFMQIVET
jgi:hypothetical protein